MISTVAPPKSILIVKLSAIGDVIHALPTLDVLRAALPDVRIGWLVEELSSPVLRNHPHLDKLYIIPKKQWRGKFLAKFRSEIAPFFRAIRADDWEATLDLQGLTKSGLASIGAGARVRVGYRGEFSRELNAIFCNRRIRTRPSDKIVPQENLRLLEGFGITVPDTPPPGTIGILPEEQEAMRAQLAALGWSGDPLVAINAGAGWATKRWPPAYYGRLARQLADLTGLRPLVVWGPGEEAWRDEIAATCGRDMIVAPPTRIRELIVLLSLVSLVVGGDTGPVHMAGPLRKAVISIFGGSDGKRNAPWAGPNGLMVQRGDLGCLPCWKTQCPLDGKDHLACLTGLTPEAVMERAKPWLQERFSR